MMRGIRNPVVLPIVMALHGAAVAEETRDGSSAVRGGSLEAGRGGVQVVRGVLAESRTQDREGQIRTGQTISELLDSRKKDGAPAGTLALGQGAVLRLVVGTAVVVLAGVGLVLVLKRWAPRVSGVNPSEGLQIVGRVSLSPRHQVFVLSLQDRRVVVGVSGDRMVSLATLDGEHDAATSRRLAAREGAAVDKDQAKDAPRLGGYTRKSITGADLMPYRRQVERLRDLLRGKDDPRACEEVPRD